MQQVNLYTPELRPKREWISATSLSCAVLGLIAVLLLASVFNLVQLNRYEQEVLDLEDQRAISNKKLERIREKAAQDSVRSLDSEISTLREKLIQRQQIKELIGSQNLGNKDGYSQRFSELAQAVFSDMSLTRFKFSEGEKIVEISGKSLNAESVATMVAQLRRTDSFEEVSFGTLTLREAESKNAIEFSFGFEPVFDRHELIAEN